MTYYFFDPGETTGYALFNEKAELVVFGQLEGLDNLFKWLRGNPYLSEEEHKNIAGPSTVMIEVFKLFPWKAEDQSWEDMKTVKAVGYIEYWAKYNEFTIEKKPQDSSVLSVAYMHAGMSRPKSHKLSHQYDAIAHGCEYLFRRGLWKPTRPES